MGFGPFSLFDRADTRTRAKKKKTKEGGGERRGRDI